MTLARLPRLLYASFTGIYISPNDSNIVCQQSALMSVLSGSLLVFVKDTQFPEVTPTGSLPFLTLLSYGGLVFNISATISAFLLTDRLGSMTINSSRRPDLPKDGTVDVPSSFLLKRYGAGAGWTWSMWHCMHLTIILILSLTLIGCRVFLCPRRAMVHHHTTPCLCILKGDKGRANWDHLRGGVCYLALFAAYALCQFLR